jgi:hypothetical protein
MYPNKDGWSVMPQPLKNQTFQCKRLENRWRLLKR